LKEKADVISKKALQNFGMQTGKPVAIIDSSEVQPITLLYHPVLQESFRHSIQGALKSALQVVQNKEVLKSIYFAMNETAIPDSLEKDLMNSQVGIVEMAVAIFPMHRNTMYQPGRCLPCSSL
jgi:ABC-2 type transport system permease protein